MQTARLVIADDHDLVRAGLRGMLEDEPGLAIVGEARDGQEAVDLCRREGPDLVLMDVQMPQMDGLVATRAIKEQCPTTSVIIVTMYESPDYLLEALKAGAAGYVLKNTRQEELVGAVRQVLGGESLLNAELATRVLRRLASESQKQPSPPPEPLPPLTPREREVLQLLAEGRTNSEIASTLWISLSTVKAHVEHIIAKLKVSDRTQAAVRAVQLDLVSAARP